MIGGMAALMLAVSVCYFIFLKKRVVEPFGKLRGFAESVAAGDLETPLEMDRGNIFGAFTESFDIMREELKSSRLREETAVKSRKEMIAELSHDIKTPVASIKAMTDFMMQGNYDVVTCNCALTDAELNIKRDAYYTTESPLDRSVWGNFKKDLWLGCCMAFRRDILDDVLPIPPQLAAHDMWISLYGQLHYHCGYYPKVLQLYRRHPETVSFAGEKSTNSLWYKLNYRAYLGWMLLWRSVQKGGRK